ncbi:hypothetical protein [Exiguobacterium sp. s192]|uniref:hypothetical protein n=1 Tax=Exiguobacterium sp. s192 TaxID=2751206 RepID=UPI001BE84219|nr:hypothetical protein [Exiguobacterium sp. s192]
MSRSRKKGQPTFKSFQGTVTEPAVNDSATESLRDEQIEAVKKFAAPAISNPYQSLPATGLSRILTKRLPKDVDGLVQYYNHIDTIQATSFVEKCRILAHANALFHSEETRAQFKAEQGSWTDFLTKIGQTRSQVSRYVSFWNVFGEKLLQKVIDADFSASKLAELLNWPEDPKLALLEERKYPTQNGELTVYEMTREQLREVKKTLNERKENNLIDMASTQLKPARINVDFLDNDDPLYTSLKKQARDQGVKPEQIIRIALELYFNKSL